MRSTIDRHTSEFVTASSSSYEVRLLGGFQLRCNNHVVETLPSSQRLLAFLALNDRSLPRSFVAASLWPDTTDKKAGANLRTALWRLHEPDHQVVDVATSHLALRAAVWVDARHVETAARDHRRWGILPGPDVVDRIRGELLPGFWDSWLVFERERLRHEMIHLYELVCSDALERREFHDAVMAALAAVECDPSRESSNACLIKSYLASGNRSDAARAFRRYSALLHEEFDMCPSLEIGSLVAGLSPAQV